MHSVRCPAQQPHQPRKVRFSIACMLCTVFRAIKVPKGDAKAKAGAKKVPMKDRVKKQGGGEQEEEPDEDPPKTPTVKPKAKAKGKSKKEPSPSPQPKKKAKAKK